MKANRFGGSGLLPVLLPLSGVVGCGPAPALQPGELGNGVFYWLCAAASDPSCSEMSEASDRFPSTVALGSAFMLQYQANSGQYLAPHSGSSHLVESSPAGTFTAVEQGYASVFVYGDEGLLDYLHLDVLAVDTLQLTSSGLQDGALQVGAVAGLQVTALCGVSSCAGALPYQWTVEPADRASISQSIGPDDQISLTGLAPGLVTVTVSAQGALGAASASLQFLVEGEPIGTGETGQLDTGIPTDTGAPDDPPDTGSEDTGTLVDDTGVTP